MDLQLGFKLTRPADEFSSANFQLLKDHRGPLFQSRETITMFILTAHLRGYKRGDIKIEINEDGTVMVIGGEKPVEETVMVGWRLYKKGTEIINFSKSFRIPDGVVLDKIEAKFNEDESVLTVSMPKTVKGMVGTVIEEMEEPEIIRQESENLPVLPEEIPQSPRKPERKLGEEHEQDSWEDDEDPSQVDKILEKASPDNDQETSLQNQVVEEQSSTIHESMAETEDEAESSGSKQQTDEEDLPKSDEVWEYESDEEGDDHTRREEDEEPGKKCSILCAPIVAGSALLLSFVVFVIQFIRTKKQPDNTK